MANSDRSVSTSQPIPIHHARHRAHSVSESSSSSSDGSCSPSSPVSPTHSPLSNTQPRIAPISPGTTPILNYFLSQSPKSPSGTFPFRRGFGTAVFEDDDTDGSPMSKHARRASTNWPTSATERYPIQNQGPPAPVPGQQERAAGLLRRLSLGGAALRPQLSPIKTGPSASAASGDRVPPNTPSVEQGPAVVGPVPRRARRSNTLAPGSQRPKRAPSPMGERILTGHFDGFN